MVAKTAPRRRGARALGAGESFAKFATKFAGRAAPAKFREISAEGRRGEAQIQLTKRFCRRKRPLLRPFQRNSCSNSLRTASYMALNHISHFFALNFSLSGRYSASDHGENAQEERNFAKVARNLPVSARKQRKKNCRFCAKLSPAPTSRPHQHRRIGSLC